MHDPLSRCTVCCAILHTSFFLNFPPVHFKATLNSESTIGLKDYEVSFKSFLLKLTSSKQCIRILEDLNNLAIVKSISSEGTTKFVKITRHIYLTFTQ